MNKIIRQDIHKYSKGELVIAFVCDSCMHANNQISKKIPDSKGESWLCTNCNHFGIGSYMICEIGDWLTLKIKEPF